MTTIAIYANQTYLVRELVDVLEPRLREDDHVVLATDAVRYKPVIEQLTTLLNIRVRITEVVVERSNRAAGARAYAEVDKRVAQLEPHVVVYAGQVGSDGTTAHNPRTGALTGVEAFRARTGKRFERAGATVIEALHVDNLDRGRKDNACNVDAGHGWTCHKAAGHAEHARCAIPGCHAPVTHLCDRTRVGIYCGAPLCDKHTSTEHEDMHFVLAI